MEDFEGIDDEQQYGLNEALLKHQQTFLAQEKEHRLQLAE